MSLTQYVIYDHPSDYPDCYVMKKWLIGPDAFDQDPTFLLTGIDIDALRAYVKSMGLICIPRSHNDDPVIVETWM